MYNAIKAEHGEEYADKWTYEHVFEFGSDELKEAVFLVTGGIAPGNKKEREVS